MYNRFNSKGFEILGVSLDRDKDAWIKAIAKDSLRWNQVSDLKYWQSEAAQAYGVKSIPHTVLIDRNGLVIARGLRGKALERKLEEIFQDEDKSGE
jgi:peroxiredoxin